MIKEECGRAQGKEACKADIIMASWLFHHYDSYSSEEWREAVELFKYLQMPPRSIGASKCSITNHGKSADVVVAAVNDAKDEPSEGLQHIVRVLSDIGGDVMTKQYKL
ncbi:hypothetical protein ATANTOWER_006769 [Ataeniobius toweri]|uniref:Uncharacterized protein n=1 Tax=Ataeniobius toweri TaxID=208326 RepID=A0ABU7C7Z9_9TELE|nr:hypothetical protein [Ataeniobius toweri]